MEVLAWTLIVFSIFLLPTHGANQVILTCGGENENDVPVPGPRGRPGKRGPAGPAGVSGLRGHKGEPGQTHDIESLHAKVTELETKLSLMETGLQAQAGKLDRYLDKRLCVGVLEREGNASGIYSVMLPNVGLVSVFCDQTTDGGGWLVFQRRSNGSENFFRPWAEYKTGFGDNNGEFWLGLDTLHRMTNSPGLYELRVELEDFDGETRYAKYRDFRVGSESHNYRLTVGGYNGNAGDALSYHNQQPFTTKDRDNDNYGTNCAVLEHGAWWYKACHSANLNGEYLGKGTSGDRGIGWHQWRGTAYSLKRAEMKLRPI